MDFERFTKTVDEHNTDPESVKDTVLFQLERIEENGRKDILDDVNINIVDVGTWKGARVEILRDKGFCNAVGIEQDPKRADANPELVKCGVAHQLPFNDETIDLVLMNDVFSDPACPKSEKYHKKVLMEFSRVLKKSGLASISESDIFMDQMQILLDDDVKFVFKILEDNKKLGSILLEKK